MIEGNPYSQKQFPIATQVAEEYCIRQASIHRQPIYRSKYGDIGLKSGPLASFLVTYFIEGGMSPLEVEIFFYQMLDVCNLNRAKHFASVGRYEGLKSDGITEIEDVLDYFAECVFSGHMRPH